MVCLSRSTIYRCTDLLVEVGIIKKKRLKSTLLYVINPDYIVNKKIDVSSRDYDVSGKHIPGFMVTDISKPIINKLTYISNIIKEVIDKDITENFNIAPDWNYSINEMTNKALDVLKVKAEIVYTNPELDGQYRKDVSNKKMKGLLPNFKFTNFEDGILRVYNGI